MQEKQKKGISENYDEFIAKDRERREQYTAFCNSIKTLDPIPRVEAWLGYIANNIEEYEEQESLVYFRSRGKKYEVQINKLVLFWKEAERIQIEKCSRGTLEVSLDSDEQRYTGGMSLESAREIKKHSPFVLSNFWEGRAEQENIIDATMLRTVEWCKIGGFDDWWERLADIYDEDTIRGGVADKNEASYFLFSMCRSDYAVKIMHVALERVLSSLEFVERGYNQPWEVLRNLEPYGGKGYRKINNLTLAASIIFGNAILRRTFLNRDQIMRAGQLLLKNQNENGGWPFFDDQNNSYIESTAIIIHGLALSKPFGWERSVDKAEKWLRNQQSDVGYWVDDYSPMPVYTTVLVLDALELLSDGTNLTFSPPFFQSGREFECQSPISKNRIYKIGLSFPGEYRDLVSRIADILSDKMGKDNIFYDGYYEHLLARPSADLYLNEIFNERCELIVVFLCSEYASKDWPQLEWRCIRDLIKRRENDKIMLFKIGEFKFENFDGFLSIDNAVRINGREPDEIVDLIIKRYEYLMIK